LIVCSFVGLQVITGAAGHCTGAGYRKIQVINGGAGYRKVQVITEGSRLQVIVGVQVIMRMLVITGLTVYCSFVGVQVKTEGCRL
jgi:hypothetical protein